MFINFLVILFAFHVGSTFSYRCLSCSGVISPLFCHRLQICNNDEVCLTEEYYTPNGEHLFNVGCFPRKNCLDGTFGHPIHLDDPGTVLNPHSNKVTCSECCDGDICNQRGCNTKYSRHGPICFNCPQSLDPSKCSTIKVCNQNEVCQIHRVFELGVHYYVTSCIPKFDCNDFTSPVFGRKRSVDLHRCCDTNLCNSVTNTTSTNGEVKSCKDLHAKGNNKDGVYTIYPLGTPTQAYCNMSFDGGGWTVIYRHFKYNTTDFNRTLAEYKQGFGDLNGDFTLGLDVIHALGSTWTEAIIKDNMNTFKIDITIGLEQNSYQLTMDNSTLKLYNNSHFQPDPLDVNIPPLRFSTYDHDVDSDDENCALVTGVGFWFPSGCRPLNGKIMLRFKSI